MAGLHEPREEHADEPIDDTGFERLLEKLSAEYKFDFREYKRASLARRIRVRMHQVRVDSYEQYLTYLDSHKGEHITLFNTILINVTGFFRDPEAWKALNDQALPHLMKGAAETRSLRVWSCGASSGEEPYTAAILIAEHLGERAQDFNVKIYATDVDEEALQAARQGLYRIEELKDLPATLLEKYFTREGQAYRFCRDLRRWCIFGRHNVSQDPPLSHIDLLICRNVMIYFTADLQDKILSRFHYAVREGGYLFLGRSESLLARSQWFTPEQLRWRIFQRTTVPAPTVAPSLGKGDYDAAGEATAWRRPPTPAVGPHLQRIVDALPAAVMVVDPMDTVLVWNASAETLYDVPAANAVGRKFRDLDVSYRVEGLRARVEEVKSKHIPARLENATFTRRSGDLVHAEILLVPVHEGQRLTGVVVFASEATEHARLREQMTRVAEQHATAIEELQSTNEELETTNEELQSTNEELETTNEELQSTNEELETTVDELQAANTELGTVNAELQRRDTEVKRLRGYYQTVLGGLGLPVVVLDRAGTVTTWNTTAERLWGLSAEQAVGRPFWALPIGDVVGLAREPIARVIASGREDSVPKIPVPPSGQGKRASLRIVPFGNAGDEVAGVICVLSTDGA